MSVASLRGKSGSLLGTHDDDALAYDAGFRHINGGPGADTLILPPATTLDLFDRKIFGIDIFNLDGGDSTIILDAGQVMRLTSAPHTLQITGIAGDAVQAGDGWSYLGMSGADAIYRNHGATLIVDTDVRRSGIVDHAPDAQVDKSLTVMEDSSATPLAIGAPLELDGDPLAVTVTGVPNAAVGAVFLGATDGGTAVSEGQALTVAQLGRLVFTPVHDASGLAGTFSYSAADQGTPLGLQDTQAVTIDVLPAPTGSRVLEQVPAYSWYHGCGPTAVASVLGYWDVQGYATYFDASGWEQVRATVNVQDEISSPLHNAKYDPTPDDPSLAVPPMTSIADFLQTSQDPSGYGWTYLSSIEPGMEGYARSRGEPLDAWTVGVDSTSWQTLVNEIDAGHPSVFLVDTNGDGITDHFVPVLGYDDRGAAGRWYGAYTTWSESETVSWYPFQPMAPGTTWGVGYATFVDEPGALAAHASPFGSAQSAAGGFIDFGPVVDVVGSGAPLATAGEFWAA